MRRAGVLTGGAVALMLLGVVCVPRHLSSTPRSAIVTPASLHAGFEHGSLVLRGSLPTERSKAAILEQAHALAAKTRMRVIDQLTVDQQVNAAAWMDMVPQFLPALGVMVERGSLIIDGRSLLVNGQVAGHREKAEILQALAPVIRAGLRIEDRVVVASTATSPSAAVPLSALQLLLNQVLTKSSIEFEPKSATITATGQAALDQIIRLLRRAPDTPIEIAGHIDAGGDAEFNMQLSRRRAEAVKQYLIGHGLSNPFTAIGYGSTRPLSQAKSPSGLHRNERIELLM
ncbi:OmpA family protein [Candidatus Nitrospira nitrificans]|uniref:Putative Outer membrane protein, ompA family n=1 Tax=Candidatus Nitrospira nitrificans TaxID=1742973 RepID=A0A0S4LHZ1_9BACT|nr:OmpA family protein [Candidatus Nitrospira nitrificans]CUS36847.1 putative Outer membrane protein, ompA family [Candidatus Nitrospira nitrificans]